MYSRYSSGTFPDSAPPWKDRSTAEKLWVLVPSSALRIINVTRMNGMNTATITEAIAVLARLSVAATAAAFTARVMAADAAISIISFLDYILYIGLFSTDQDTVCLLNCWLNYLYSEKQR